MAVGTLAGQRIGTMTLMNGAFARIRAAGMPFLALFLVTAGLSVGLQFGAKALSVSTVAVGLSPGYIVNVTLATVIGAVSSALCLRLILEGPEQWLRLDRRLAETAGMLGFATMSFVAINLVWGAILAAGATASPGATAFRAFGGLLIYVAAIYVMLKLALWPLARLTGRVEVTPARSWRLMRKATRGYLLALMIALVPVSVPYFFAIRAGGVANMTAPITLTVSAILGAAFSLYGQTVLATLFALRVEAPATVADVFD